MTFKVDSSMFGGYPSSPDDIFRHLDRTRRPDLRFHYSGTLCAHRWLNVCSDPAYGHVDLLRRVEFVLPALMRVLQNDLGRREAITFVSLGPGDGALDEAILRRVDHDARLNSYCALDFSFELLQIAVGRIARASGFRTAFPIHAVCADFTKLQNRLPNGLPEDERRLFSLTGFTLGNYPEVELLSGIRRLMRDGDFLFLDARLHRAGNEGAEPDPSRFDRTRLLRSYDLASVKRFVFGPLEVATHARAEDACFGYDLVHLPGSIPTAVQVLIYCSGLETALRLSGQPIERDRLDLAVTTLYDRSALISGMETMGFDVVWHQDVEGVALLLVRKTG